MMVIQRACYVNCGLPDDQCACYRDNKPPLLYDPMPRQDLRVGPDTIAKSDDFVSLPRAEVEALMEAVDALDDEYCGQQYGPSLHTIDKMRMALLALQERMK